MSAPPPDHRCNAAVTVCNIHSAAAPINSADLKCHDNRELKKNKTEINKLKRFIFIWSDYESFTERNVITARVETQLQMRKLWLTLPAHDGGFMNCTATLNCTMSNVACVQPTDMCAEGTVACPPPPPTKPSGIHSGFPPFPLHVFCIIT